jgi:hypothetical protein
MGSFLPQSPAPLFREVFRGWTPFKVVCSWIVFALIVVPASSASGPPAADIDNGVVHAQLFLPDAAKGFYRGTRFDWSGVIGSLTYSGHSFYDPWFTKTDPAVLDFVYDGADIVAGPCTAITGPAEEFESDGGALGYESAGIGGTFVKIGVGVLRKPDAAKYLRFRLYEIVDGGRWTVKVKPSSVEFTQRVFDRSSGYGYEYRKVVRLVAGSPLMEMEHTLRNIGTRPIDTSVYDHNFLVLDHQPVGPDFTVTVPYGIELKKPIEDELGKVEGGKISYRRQLVGKDRFTAYVGGFSDRPADYDVTVENAKVGAGVRVTSDRPLESEELWSIRSVLAIEPYVHLSIAPGGKTAWRYRYTYRATPRKD